MNYNRVIIAGNLTKDPELRYTPKGNKTVTLRLALNRKFKTKAGEVKEDVCYVNVCVWDKQAEKCVEVLKKGKCVLVEGRLQQRNWMEENGEKRSILEVRAELIKFVDYISNKPETLPDTSTEEK